MNIEHRKTVIAIVVAFVLALANMNEVVSWLEEAGVLPWARQIRSEYLTGTAIAVILALLVLVPGRAVWVARARRCLVCDALLRRQGRYCAECGSRL